MNAYFAITCSLRTRFNGVPAVEVEVFRTGNESIIEITSAVREYIASKQSSLPEGLQLDYWRDLVLARGRQRPGADGAGQDE